MLLRWTQAETNEAAEANIQSTDEALVLNMYSAPTSLVILTPQAEGAAACKALALGPTGPVYDRLRRPLRTATVMVNDSEKSRVVGPPSRDDRLSAGCRFESPPCSVL